MDFLNIVANVINPQCILLIVVGVHTGLKWADCGSISASHNIYS